MENTLSEYMHYIVSAIIFVSAVTFLILLLNSLSETAKVVLPENQEKPSITMNTGDYYVEDPSVLRITGSQVYTDILALPSNIEVQIGTDEINKDTAGKNMLKHARNLETDYCVKLSDKINFNKNDYEKICVYDATKNGELIQVIYR